MIHKKILFVAAFVLIFSLVLPINAEIESPKKQMQKGVLAVDVMCKEGLELVIRINGFAACVRAETAEKMEKKGMLFIPIGFTKSEKEIQSPRI